MTETLTWLDETAALVRDRSRSISLRDISDACHVSIGWLSKLQNGRLTDASVSKLQTVNTWLKKNKR